MEVRSEERVMQLTDRHGRRINYLRLSVTDRCDMRCVYCMPAEGIPKLDHCEVLSYEELHQLAEAAVAVGIEKIRVTGGEPLVRKGIINFLERLATIPGLKQLVLTTNGQLLDGMAADLQRAGVQRLNISLDSLQHEVFARITRCGDLGRVLAGIRAAEAAGLPIKINMVVMRGVNDNEIADFAALTLEKDCSVRFIEYMPTKNESGWQSLVVPGEEILARLSRNYQFSPIIRGELAGPAREFRIAGAQGNIGVITALSGHFCQDCNRIRMTAAGKMRNCLFAAEEFDLRVLLASGDAGALQAELRRLVNTKPARHAMNAEEADHASFVMASIGG
jgi:cyclic pyranopterin phosphate synthase